MAAVVVVETAEVVVEVLDTAVTGSPSLVALSEPVVFLVQAVVAKPRVTAMATVARYRVRAGVDMVYNRTGE